VLKIVRTVVAESGKKLNFDPAGFFTVLLDRERGVVVVEHYLNVDRGSGRIVDTGRLNRVFEGRSAGALCDAIIDAGLVTRLDHAAYLGRELATAQRCLGTDEEYEQDSGDGPGKGPDSWKK
jgi:tetrahydromethanopterin S-methyltransferase subunit A